MNHWKPLNPPPPVPDLPRVAPYGRTTFSDNWTLTHGADGYVRLGFLDMGGSDLRVVDNPDYKLLFSFQPDHLVEAATRLLEAHLVNELGAEKAEREIKDNMAIMARVGVARTVPGSSNNRMAVVIGRLREIEAL